MSHEQHPSSEQSTVKIVEFQAQPEQWAEIADRCEEILGGTDGRTLSQRTWMPDDQPGALNRFGITYGVSLRLNRVGEIKPSPATTYTLHVFDNVRHDALFRFQPKLDEPSATLTGSQPVDYLGINPSVTRFNELQDYLQTYLGDAHG